LALEPGLIMTIMSPSIEEISGPTRPSDSVVRALIARHLDVDIGRVTDDASFIDDLGADWLDRLELMIVIEDHFPGIEIPEDDADRIQVVGDLIRYIECGVKRQQQRPMRPEGSTPGTPDGYDNEIPRN
jgi:acyl carrier protein